MFATCSFYCRLLAWQHRCHRDPQKPFILPDFFCKSSESQPTLNHSVMGQGQGDNSTLFFFEQNGAAELKTIR